MPYTDIRIRGLKLWEVPQLLAFQAEHDYRVFPEERLETPLLLYSLLKILWHRERMETFVALRGGKIIGYMSLVFGRHKTFHGNAYLVSVAVHADERGKGIGSQLFAFTEEYARARGTRRIEFEVFSRNVGALRLYKRLGYEVEGVKRRAVEYRGEYDDLVFLAKFI